MELPIFGQENTGEEMYASRFSESTRVRTSKISKGYAELCSAGMQPYLRPPQELYYLVVRWKSFSHPNVLPFLGVSGPEIASPFGIITPRVSSNIKEYTRERRGANRLLLVGAFRD